MRITAVIRPVWFGVAFSNEVIYLHCDPTDHESIIRKMASLRKNGLLTVNGEAHPDWALSSKVVYWG